MMSTSNTSADGNGLSFISTMVVKGVAFKPNAAQIISDGTKVCIISGCNNETDGMSWVCKDCRQHHPLAEEALKGVLLQKALADITGNNSPKFVAPVAPTAKVVKPAEPKKVTLTFDEIKKINIHVMDMIIATQGKVLPAKVVQTYPGYQLEKVQKMIGIYGRIVIAYQSAEKISEIVAMAYDKDSGIHEGLTRVFVARYMDHVEFTDAIALVKSVIPHRPATGASIVKIMAKLQKADSTLRVKVLEAALLTVYPVQEVAKPAIKPVSKEANAEPKAADAQEVAHAKEQSKVQSSASTDRTGKPKRMPYDRFNEVRSQVVELLRQENGLGMTIEAIKSELNLSDAEMPAIDAGIEFAAKEREKLKVAVKYVSRKEVAIAMENGARSYELARELAGGEGGLVEYEGMRLSIGLLKLALDRVYPKMAKDDKPTAKNFMEPDTFRHIKETVINLLKQDASLTKDAVIAQLMLDETATPAIESAFGFMTLQRARLEAAIEFVNREEVSSRINGKINFFHLAKEMTDMHSPVGPDGNKLSVKLVEKALFVVYAKNEPLDENSTRTVATAGPEDFIEEPTTNADQSATSEVAPEVIVSEPINPIDLEKVAEEAFRVMRREHLAAEATGHFREVQSQKVQAVTALYLDETIKAEIRNNKKMAKFNNATITDGIAKGYEWYARSCAKFSFLQEVVESYVNVSLGGNPPSRNEVGKWAESFWLIQATDFVKQTNIDLDAQSIEELVSKTEEIDLNGVKFGKKLLAAAVYSVLNEPKKAKVAKPVGDKKPGKSQAQIDAAKAKKTARDQARTAATKGKGGGKTEQVTKPGSKKAREIARRQGKK